MARAVVAFRGTFEIADVRRAVVSFCFRAGRGLGGLAREESPEGSHGHGRVDVHHPGLGCITNYVRRWAVAQAGGGVGKR